MYCKVPDVVAVASVQQLEVQLLLVTAHASSHTQPISQCSNVQQNTVLASTLYIELQL
jgi:hypothetical protein